MAARSRGPATLQVVPPGLVGHLQLKSLGEAPQTFSDVTSSVMDLREWYLVGRQLSELALLAAQPTGIVVTGTGFFTFAQVGGALYVVPQNQIWWVDKMAVRASLAGAADILKIQACIYDPNGSQVPIGLPDQIYPSTTSGAQTLWSYSARGFWAPPGTGFGLQVGAYTAAGSPTATLSLRATPCPL